MRLVLVLVIVQTCFLNAQSIIWEKSIPLDELGSYYLKGIDISENGEIYIGVQDDPWKSAKYMLGDSRVIGLDLKGNVILDKNYSELFDEGFAGVAAKENGFYFAGNSNNGLENKTMLFTSDTNGNILDSIVLESSWVTYSSKNIKNVSENCVLQHYTISEGYPDRYYNDFLVERDSVLEDLITYNAMDSVPDSVLNYYYVYSGFEPQESTLWDFHKTDSGMLLSGYIGGWAARFQFSFIKFVNNENIVIWEKYYPYYDPEVFPDGRMMWFDNFCAANDFSYFLARLWYDADMDYQLDEAECFLTKIDSATGENIWIIDYPSSFELQIFNIEDDRFLIRTGTKVAKVTTNDFGLDTIWETDFTNTGMITTADGGYISALSTGDQLNVFRYYEYAGIEDVSTPTSTELHQNYPNPFNPSTEISYSLKTDGMVTLSVFNTKGELVRTLANEKKTAGNYSINFNGEGLNSGIYFYRLNVDGKAVQSRKMMMLK